MNNNYMNLKLPEVAGSIMGAQISANTAYQYVGELLRSNGFNYRQITQFAKNMSKN
jgi:hypothetical protein